jgi:serine/threonine protein kinase
MRARVSSLAPDAMLAGRFRIRRALGQGSMGSVFEAEDGRDGRIVALKVSAPDDAADARARRRLAREVDAGRTIDSPHVVRALATGEDSATGLVWIALDLAPGPSLDAYVREHAPLELAVAGRLLLQLGDALAAAHRVGVVHRDLKPDNIRVEERPEGPWLRVLDFGIAKSVAGLEVSATAPGLGAPLWVAPEQSRAGNAPAPSADVWSYGLVAFFVLTGKLYWWHAREASSLAELALEIVKGTLETPSARARALGVARPLPVGFDAWFARTVTREPGARFAEADAARSALAAVLDARPIDRGGPVVERPWRLLLVLLAGCAAMGYAISRIIRG